MIGQSLIKAREARGWSRAQMAEELGVKLGTYGGYEVSGILPSNSVLDRIAEKIPEMAERIAEVRRLRPKRKLFARAAVGGQTSEAADRQHAAAILAARRRRA
jgi:transcriptional regulator with XRE-family HTH domain